MTGVTMKFRTHTRFIYPDDDLIQKKSKMTGVTMKFRTHTRFIYPGDDDYYVYQSFFKERPSVSSTVISQSYQDCVF